jgi:hypothetical protein
MEDYRLTQTGQQVQDILDGAAMQSDLTAEKERAELAEQTLQGNIDAEALARQQQDGTLDGKIDANTARIVSIEGKIPSGASTENKLATELYVNSSVATNTATFRGTYNLVSDLHLSIDATNEQIAYMLAATIATADNNDYCFVQFPTSAETPTEIRKIARFKYNGEAWGFEYDLNNSGFTSDQWAAINSGITSGNVAKLAALPTSVELTALLNGKQNMLTFDTAPTPSSTNPVTSGGIHTAIDNEKGARQNADATLQQAIEAILALIPSAATALNQLADKAFVNSSIATNTATFRGTFNLVSDLHLAIDATHDQIATVLAASIATADNNDYCYVQIPTSATTPTEIAKTERYKFNGTAWAYEYDLNNSGFTANQWAAINSGITVALVTKLGDLPTATEIANQFTAITNLIPEEATALNQLADKAYVLAQILSATPAFKGQFTTLADLQAVASPKAGDLGIVRTKDSDGYDVFVFYQYLNSQWNVFYTLSHHLLKKPASTGTTGDYPYNGMGRVVIPKNMVNIAEQGEPENIVNLLTQDAFEDGEGNPLENTVYVIQYDFTLGEDITLPANCVLEFDGGSINGNYTENSTITLNSCTIQAEKRKIFNNVNITQETGLCLRTSWFGCNDSVDCGPILKKLFEFARNFSTIIVDTNILINSEVIPDYPVRYLNLLGESEELKSIGDRLPVIRSTMSYGNISKETSLITLQTEGLCIKNISFIWDKIDETTNFPANILKLTTYVQGGVVYQEGDTYIFNCSFYKQIRCVGGSCISAVGRGLEIYNCILSDIETGTSTSTDIPNACISITGSGDTQPQHTAGFMPKNSMRRIVIRNNMFHQCNGYFIRFLQNPNNAETTFYNSVICSNVSDGGPGSAIVWSTSKHRGLLISDNSLSGAYSDSYDAFGINGITALCHFENDISGLNISNNIVSGPVYDDPIENIRQYALGGLLEIIKQGTFFGEGINVCDNYIDAERGSWAIFFNCSAGSTLKDIKISNNTFSRRALSVAWESSSRRFFYSSGVYIKQAHVTNNIYNNDTVFDEFYHIEPTSYIERLISLFNSGFQSVDTDRYTTLIDDSKVINPAD